MAATISRNCLSDLSQDHDPHPPAFDEAMQTLRDLGQPGIATGPRLAQFELVLLRELGYGPALDACAACGNDIGEDSLAYSAAAGGIVCRSCWNTFRERRPLSIEAWQAMRRMRHGGEGWKGIDDPATRREVRQMLDDSVSYLLGRRPKLLPYLGS
ncbi:MAG: DNA repair protein RecO C-terminal domain-containing protein [Gemmataceae bacterium]